jgi:hypothetical protein
MNLRHKEPKTTNNKPKTSNFEHQTKNFKHGSLLAQPHPTFAGRRQGANPDG